VHGNGNPVIADRVAALQFGMKGDEVLEELALRLMDDNDGESVADHSCHDGTVTGMGGDPRSNRHQQAVSDPMAAQVVHMAETFDIQEKETDLLGEVEFEPFLDEF